VAPPTEGATFRLALRKEWAALLAPPGGYGRKIIPLLNVNNATTKTTISVGTIFKTFIAGPYRPAKIVSVQY